MSHFVYRLVPPRPTFGPGDMTEEEAEIMAEHGGYWAGLVAEGVVVVVGPVLDPEGNWGLGVLEAEDEAAARALIDADPAITSGLGTAEVLPMPVAIAREAPRP